VRFSLHYSCGQMTAGDSTGDGTGLRFAWRTALSWVGAVVLFVGLFTLLHVTAGTGGLATGIAVALLLTWVRVWKHERTYRRQLWIAVLGLAAVTVVWDGSTFGRYVLTDNGDTATQRVTTWGRDHGLGRIIDQLELWTYSDPPAAVPAEELELAVTTTSTVATSTTESAVTTTTIYTPASPAPLAPVLSRPLVGEGQWLPVMQANGVDVMWATSLRPLRSSPSVVATIVQIDQTYLRTGMFNGREVPGGDWIRDDSVPGDLLPSLLAVMNGGFRLEHTYGGYMTEGRVVQELIPGRGTVAISRDGRMTIGELGRDVFDDGTWQTLRQNLVLIVDNGQSGVERARRERVFWGAFSSGEIYVNRSAVCEMSDGRLTYVMAGLLDAPQLAEVLISIGCWRAVQLDINGSWPSFVLFGHGEGGTLQPVAVDRRMSSDPMRYVTGSSKEFFAFFDAELVPDLSVLDG